MCKRNSKSDTRSIKVLLCRVYLTQFPSKRRYYILWIPSSWCRFSTILRSAVSSRVSQHGPVRVSLTGLYRLIWRHPEGPLTGIRCHSTDVNISCLSSVRFLRVHLHGSGNQGVCVINNCVLKVHCKRVGVQFNSIQYDLFKQHSTTIQFKTIQICYTGIVV